MATTTTSSPQKTALLLIDIQASFSHPTHWGTSRSNPQFESNSNTLLNSYRSLLNSPTSSNHKLIHIHHSSLLPSSPLHPAHPSAGIAPASYALPLPGEEPIIYKSVNSAFIGTPLETILRTHFGKEGGGKLYVCGLTTDHCVSTSVRMAANLGVTEGEGGKGEVVLIEDATAAFGKGGFEGNMVHRVHVASLSGEFARIVRTEEVVREWEGMRGESTS